MMGSRARSTLAHHVLLHGAHVDKTTPGILDTYCAPCPLRVGSLIVTSPPSSAAVQDLPADAAVAALSERRFRSSGKTLRRAANNLGLEFLQGRGAVLQRCNLRFQLLQCCNVVLQAGDLAFQWAGFYAAWHAQPRPWVLQ